MTVLLFAQLYAAHLIADFLLQPDWIARHKRELRPLSAHALIHVMTACALVNLGLSSAVIAGIFALSVTHVLIDYGKARFSSDGWAAFLVDQLAHLVSVGTAATLLSVEDWHSIRQVWVAALRSPRPYLLLGGYVGVIFGGGFLVQKVAQPFLARIEGELQVRKPGLPAAGMYIGWIERFLVTTFIIAGFNEAVGFLLAVKALARVPEIKEDTRGLFADYFLIGTLTSVGLALVGGFAMKMALAAR